MTKGFAIVMIGSLISAIYFYDTNAFISLVSVGIFVSCAWTMGKV